MSDRATVYTYDDNGNLIKMVAPDKSALYVYDANNRLIKATVQDGTNVIVEEYTYDFAGNRTSKATTTDGGFDFIKYLLDTNCGLTQVLAELNADGTVKAYYIRGTDLISQERDGKISYYLYDGHGSVRMLADEKGNITDTYDYDAFGNLTNSTGNTVNSYMYCGEQFDGTTGLYYLRARYMNPNTGTFISMDSYAGSIFEPVSLHKYLYANANPVMYSDPSGYMADLNELQVSEGCMAIIDVGQQAYNQMCLAVYKDLVIGIAAVAVTAVLSYLLYELVSYYINDITAGYETSSQLVYDIADEAIDGAMDGTGAGSDGSGGTGGPQKDPNEDINKLIRSAIKHAKTIIEHLQKSLDYYGNPLSGDNMNILKNAASEITAAIISGRISCLDKQLANQVKELIEVLEEIVKSLQ